MKLKIAAGFLAFFLVMITGFTLRSQFTHRQQLDRLIEAWKSEYHLSDEQAARIRKIEEGYHGTGNVFNQPAHNFEQLVNHDVSISRIMNPEDAARFLADREKIAKSRAKRIRPHAH